MMTDEPMHSEPMHSEPMHSEPTSGEPVYGEWLANRQATEPSRELTDRVMAAVEERDMRRRRYVRLVNRMNKSRPARWVACLAASLVGSLPFLFVAHAAKLFVL